MECARDCLDCINHNRGVNTRLFIIVDGRREAKMALAYKNDDHDDN